MADPNIPHLSGAQAIQRAESLIATAYRSGMTDPKELANFMGQVQHESQNFTRLEENLNYSGSRLYDVFPGRNGLTREGAQALTDMPNADERRQAVGEQIYGKPWGERRLGNTEDGDGHTFRGRGYMQLTGRRNYEHFGEATGLDLIAHPELAATEANAEKLAVSFWQKNVQRVPGANTDVTQAGSIINNGSVGGPVNGLADRQANATAWEAALGKKGYLESVLACYPTHLPAADRDTPKPSDPQVPNHQPLSPDSERLMQSSEQQVRQFAERHQIPWDAGLDNTVAAVANQARQNGLTNITHFNVVDGQIRVAQFDGQTIKETSLDAATAANTDPQRSFGQIAQLDQQQQPQQAMAPAELNVANPTHEQASPALAR